MKYFLDRDDDSHWYVVRDDKRKEWEDWLAADPYSPDFDAYPPSNVAYSIGGWFGDIVFENPFHGKEPVEIN